MPAMAAPNYENPNDPWTLVKSEFGEMEKWRADALTTGSMGAYSAYMRDTITRFDKFRNDSISFVDSLINKERDLSAREDALAARERVVADLMGRAASLLDRVNARIGDAEKFAEPISLPPGEQRAEDAPAPSPGGELHAVPPTEEPDLEADQELPPELERLEPESPPPSGTAFPQPTAISLNSEEEEEEEERGNR
jgi:hypothetical protein